VDAQQPSTQRVSGARDGLLTEAEVAEIDATLEGALEEPKLSPEDAEAAATLQALCELGQVLEGFPSMSKEALPDDAFDQWSPLESAESIENSQGGEGGSSSSSSSSSGSGDDISALKDGESSGEFSEEDTDLASEEANVTAPARPLQREEEDHFDFYFPAPLLLSQALCQKGRDRSE